jgi:nucleotide-binding universal stress UspA family protein
LSKGALMLRFSHILCPVDFSESSARALSHAAALTRRYDAELEVLHIVPAVGEDSDPVHFDRGTSVWPSRAQVTREIERVMQAAGASGPRARADVRDGRAHEVIAFRARTWPAELLVMGTHGRSGFNRLLLGSVTEKVLRNVTCPVLTVPPAAPASADASVAFTQIVCAVDFTPSSMKALAHALDLGQQAGGRVSVLYALEYMEPDAALLPSPFDPCHEVVLEGQRQQQLLIDRARTRLQAVLAREPGTWCDIDPHVVTGRAYKAVLDHARTVQADLIVMGAQGASGLELMVYGSNTQHVLRAAACPVMTVRA